MTNGRNGKFLGTYFDRDVVLRVARAGDVLSWVVVGVYTIDLLLAILGFTLQYLRGYMTGLGITDLLTNVVYIVERPFRGIIYFIALQAISKVLLILMDMEENTRRFTQK